MSTTYPDLPETNYPDGEDRINRMSDLSYDDLPLVAQYYTYYNAGNLSAANALLKANPSLEAKIFNAARFNRLEDRTIALERYFLNKLQNYLNEQLTYREPYNASTTYKKTNIIDYNGEGFICRVDTSVGVAPVNGQTTPNWALIAKQGIQGVSGIGLTPRGDWNDSTQYYANDFVAHLNCFWQCDLDNINSEPTQTSTNWSKLANVGVQDDYLIATDLGTEVLTEPIKADELKTSRKIGNADFNGAKDITLQQIGIMSHASTHAIGGADAINPSNIGIKDSDVAVSPDVAAALGLTGNPQVKDVLAILSSAINPLQYVWNKYDYTYIESLGNPFTLNFNSPPATHTFTIKRYTSITIDNLGAITPINGTDVTISSDIYGGITNSNALNGFYFYDGGTLYKGTGVITTNSQDISIFLIPCRTVTSVVQLSNKQEVTSYASTTYPQDGIQSSYYYKYIGRPPAMPTQIALGTYTGTGTYGIANPNSLAFDFVPKMVIISESWITNAVYSPQPFISKLSKVSCIVGRTDTGGSYSSYIINLIWDKKILRWYSENMYTQLNVSGQMYSYIAIG